MAECKDCIHENVCVIKAFPEAFENTQWEKKPCDHFKPTVDVAPKSEGERPMFENTRNILLHLKRQIHDKAVRPHSAGIDAYINLKVFDAILQTYLNKLK